MRYLLILFIFFCVAACVDNTADVNLPIGQGNISNYSNFPFYTSIEEMMNVDLNYSETLGTFAVLSEVNGTVNIQVSTIVDENTSTEDLLKLVKKDIVFVAMQTFAKTDVYEFYITAVPLQINSQNAESIYLRDFQDEAFVIKRRGYKVIKALLNLENFNQLFVNEDSYYVINANFRSLFDVNLDEAHRMLTLE